MAPQKTFILIIIFDYFVYRNLVFPSIGSFSKKILIMKLYHNRQSIQLRKNSQQIILNKNTIADVFSTSLNQNMQTYLNMEREKLKNLDLNVAKKIIATAEKSLLNFVHSKNKVSCMNLSENYKPYMTIKFPTKNRIKCEIFDTNKL